MKEWSNLSNIIIRRTYSRNDNGYLENWKDIVERVIGGNIRGFDVSENEINRLRYFMMERKAMPAGRGLWFSGSPMHEKLGGAAAVNCWFLTADHWNQLVIGQDLLMLGGGVGLSVEHRFVSKFPKIKKGVVITHKLTKDADFIVPDSREGWNELTYRTLESFFVTGKSFSYSTICVREYGQPIKGFGGTASGAGPLISCIDKIQDILHQREGKNPKPLDVSDLFCAIGEMVVMGNVRRSAIIILGDAWDKDYLKAKRWDLGIIPSYRAMANFSVVCDDIEDVHPNYWKTYYAGEAFGIFNRTTAQKYGRMGEERPDTAIGCNPCAEAMLENGAACNLQEICLPNLNGLGEFEEAARLMHKWGKRVTCEKYHHNISDEIVKQTRRIGTGITGCLDAPDLFQADILDRVYKLIQNENISSSNELNIPLSIRTTLVKPSGTLSLLMDCKPGVHGDLSRYSIRRVRFGANDPLIRVLKEAGHHIEPVQRFDNTLDHSTLVVDFYKKAPDGTPCVDEGFDTWKQLDALLFTQRYWADQAVSVTVYYKREEIPKIQDWLETNIGNLKTISFLCHNDHGFKQAPIEAITKQEYEKLSSKIKPVDLDAITEGQILDNLECEGGYCPIR